MKNKNIYLILSLLLTAQTVIAQPKKPIVLGVYEKPKPTPVDKFELTTIKDVTVGVTHSEEWIKTKTTLNSSKDQFEVEYHFDNEELYYIRLVKIDEQVDEKYAINRVKKNGFGYRSVTADKKIDFSLKQEFSDKERLLITQFTKNPDFKNDEQLVAYFKYLYGEVADYLAKNIGTVYFFGEAIAKNKIDYLYYRFDDQKFSPIQKVKTSSQRLANKTKKYENRYRFDFNRKQLKNHQTIYFSSSLTNPKDTALMNQNSINLVALRKRMLISGSKTGIQNDIFMDQIFDHLTAKDGVLNEDEKQLIGVYGIKTADELTFQLRGDKTYYKKDGDKEYIGLWKLGKSSNTKAIDIYNIYTIDRSVGNKSQPVDVGSSFHILFNGEKLMYPIAPPAYTELKKL